MQLLFFIALVQAAGAAAQLREGPLSLKAGEVGSDGLLHGHHATIGLKPGEARGDGLLHWGDGQLDLARSSFATGSSLVLAASKVEPGSNWPACSWITPGGHIWRIENGLVVDEQGVEVEGVQIWEGGDENKEVCGVRILVCSEEHRGRWMVTTQLEDGRQLALALETEDDVSEGLRLPNDFEPLSYDIGLVPELFPSTSTHKQRFRGTSLMQLRSLATQPSLTFHSDELAINLANISTTRMDSQPDPFLPQEIV